ncbi:phosphate signaling complex protein PhoU [Amycolatopsis samaneae]|uniref:Phosphate-specific transport system accessory protein PhoU n=1 Tax=Amycolatopsis samaneae TaxID=664691 RepID=A0ABW5GRB0_9PSEU
MREAYREELARFVARLAELTGLAEQAVGRATTALLTDDPVLAGEVVAEAEKIHAFHHALESEALTLLARQQPVATDLRTIVAGLRMSVDLERMGALVRHLAEFARRGRAVPVVPAMARELVAEMGGVARRLTAEARQALTERNAAKAPELAREDDEMDRLAETLYRRLQHADTRPDLETAMDVALLGRYYERFADHAVSLGKRIAFALHGYPEDAGKQPVP